MTRINTWHPRWLSDQHAAAERKEINQLLWHYANSVWVRDGRTCKLPETYRLGTGHVRFFYDKLGFIKKRWDLLTVELLRRDFKLEATFGGNLDSVAYSALQRGLRIDGNNWTPSIEDHLVLLPRIKERLLGQEDPVRYYGREYATQAEREEFFLFLTDSIFHCHNLQEAA